MRDLDVESLVMNDVGCGRLRILASAMKEFDEERLRIRRPATNCLVC